MQHQQNVDKYEIGFIVLNVANNNYETILPLIAEIKKVLTNDEKVKLMAIPFS